jgi:hypothetical protein
VVQIDAVGHVHHDDGSKVGPARASPGHLSRELQRRLHKYGADTYPTTATQRADRIDIGAARCTGQHDPVAAYLIKRMASAVGEGPHPDVVCQAVVIREPPIAIWRVYLANFQVLERSLTSTDRSQRASSHTWPVLPAEDLDVVCQPCRYENRRSVEFDRELAVLSLELSISYVICRPTRLGRSVERA